MKMNKAICFLLNLLLLSEFTLGGAEKKDYGTAIGIDLGTTYYCVGVYKNGNVEIIANEQGSKTTPSWVAFTDGDEILIGEEAINQAAINPNRTIFGVKRLIGRKFDDPVVQAEVERVPYKIVNKNAKPYIQVEMMKSGEIKSFSPEEITAMILHKIKQTAESYLGEEIKRAVITVPAYFDHAQRQATKDASQIAGFDKVRIIDEPIAAASISHSYDFDDKKVEKRNILVFHLGGGTMDVTILSLDGGGVFKVLSNNVDNHYGGEVFDQNVIYSFVRLILNKYNKDILNDKQALGKLRKECESAKRLMLDHDGVRVQIEALFDGTDFSEPLPYYEVFEELNMYLFNDTMGHVKQALKDAGLQKTDIDEIVLEGGSTRILSIRKMLKNFFGEIFPNKVMNPEETVAFGAAVQGQDDSDGIHIINVTPISLGITTAEGIMTKLIPINTVIPTKKSQVFTTYYDHQKNTTVAITVVEGERSMAAAGYYLGKFELSGIPPAPSGVPEIEVTFEVDRNGKLHVTAMDKATNNSNSITFTKEQHLDKEETGLLLIEVDWSAPWDRFEKEKIDSRLLKEEEEGGSRVNDRHDPRNILMVKRAYEKSYFVSEDDSHNKPLLLLEKPWSFISLSIQALFLSGHKIWNNLFQTVGMWFTLMQELL